MKKLSEEQNKVHVTEDKENEDSMEQVATDEAIFNEAHVEEDMDQEDESMQPGHLQETVENQKKEISRLQDEIDSLNNQVLRAKADYDNLRRRTNDEKVAARKYRAQELVENILPVIDNFERALDASEDNEETKALKQGMEMVYRQLVDALQKEGVEEIQADGEGFDPNVHQAVMQVESNEHDPNTVVEVLQKGYMLNGRVIRPAMVKVNS